MSTVFDFDTLPNRHHTGSLKWAKYAGRDILPMWVADMDFLASPAIVEALQRRVAHGVYGYTIPYPEVEDAVIGYMQREYAAAVERDWIVWMPGLVPALNAACRGFGEAGDAVMTNSPVYPPFLTAPGYQEKRLQAVPLILENQRYTFDFAAMEAALTSATRMFILCNPHNPVGRAWNREELMQVVEFCRRHELILISDEIHCDLIFKPGVRHLTALNLGDWAADNSLTLMAPSKTYNIPGLSCSFVIIPNAHLRNRFQQAARGMITEINCMGYAGCEAAFTHGEPWRQQLLQVLRSNYEHVYTTIQQSMPLIHMRPMEATYLAWLDVAALSLERPDQHFESFGVGLSNGALFGDSRFLRFNFGCPRSMVDAALERMQQAYNATLLF